ncbi:MAG: hypothetical protein FJ000_01985 [Actinobacteria bacterium]|nr:hypothetical protein [Actinomycetota bacterium]
MRLAGDEIVERGLPGADRRRQPVFAALGAGQLLRPLGVTPACPRRSGTGQTDGSHLADDRDEHPEEPGPQLAFQEAEDGEGEVDDDHDHEHRMGGGADTRVPLAHERSEAEQEQHGDAEDYDDRVDREAPFCGPVDVLQAQDEGELIERERHAAAEEHGGELQPEAGRQECDEQQAGDHHDHHADHHVVHVQAVVGLDVVEPPADVGPDETGVGPYADERQQESDEEPGQSGPLGAEEALADGVDGERGSG